MTKQQQPSLLQRFIEARRAEIVVLVVLPISLLIAIQRALVDWFFFPSSSQTSHENRVGAVVRAVQVQTNRETTQQQQQQQQTLRTDRSPYHSHSLRNDTKANTTKIPLGSLRCVLSLDIDVDATNESGIVHVEPGATVGEVTTYLLQRGWMLECCLEMEDATLGGLAMAQGMTTHSHRCGLLSETVTEYTVVTAEGDLRVVREDNEHADLFRALPMSHGTLGFLVALRLRVIPSKPWVKLTYTPIYKRSALHELYTDVLDQAANDDPKTPFFVESIAFGKETSVLMTGYLSATNRNDDDDKTPATTNRIGWWWKPWFFKHVESKLQLKQATTEYIPIREYLMRHDRSMCMTMSTIIPYGNHILFRLLLGWLLPPQMTFLKSSHTPETREASLRKQCYQDVCFPSARLPIMLDFVEREFGIYPLLVYPCMLRNDRKAFVRVPPNDKDTNSNKSYNLNLGIYGIPPAMLEPNNRDKVYPMVTKVRRLEAWLRDIGGFQHTYCDSFQTEEEFSAMFDTDGLYKDMRTKYKCEGVFPSVYDKTRPEMDIWGWLREEEKDK